MVGVSLRPGPGLRSLQYMLECTLLKLRLHVSVAAIWHALHS